MTAKKKPKLDVTRHVGARVREIREARGMLQYDLANSLGISAKGLSHSELGRTTMTAERLYKIAMLLGVSPCEFFAGLPGVTKGQAND